MEASDCETSSPVTLKWWSCRRELLVAKINKTKIDVPLCICEDMGMGGHLCTHPDNNLKVAGSDIEVQLRGQHWLHWDFQPAAVSVFTTNPTRA